MTTLDQLRPGERAEVVSLTGQPGLVQRLYELGLIEGEPVELVALAPLGDPIEIRVGNARLTLRKAEAAGIAVRNVECGTRNAE
ncbi:MAG TPA: ferrous iron transport protein A [Gemmataceae bacterium]|nr:ferrous iron transport protein A [Gemmataceae bacterium]